MRFPSLGEDRLTHHRSEYIIFETATAKKSECDVVKSRDSRVRKSGLNL
jgi:hypothetical protein